jgi:hypothetical protein
MTTLHIAHDVRDFDEWLATFQSFEAFRAESGVTTSTVRRGVDDPNHVAIDLGFASAEPARAFLAHLETNVWPLALHLVGTPTRTILAEVG